MKFSPKNAPLLISRHIKKPSSPTSKLKFFSKILSKDSGNSHVLADAILNKLFVEKIQNRLCVRIGFEAKQFSLFSRGNEPTSDLLKRADNEWR